MALDTAALIVDPKLMRSSLFVIGGVVAAFVCAGWLGLQPGTIALLGAAILMLLQARGRLTVGEAFAVLEPVLAGLTAAHRAGIAHRDVKPENVLISTDGQVALTQIGRKSC